MHRWFWVTFVFLFFCSEMAAANPLGMLLSGKRGRGRLEVSYQADTMDDQVREARSQNEGLRRSSAKVNLNVYKSEEQVWFVSGQAERIDLGVNEVQVGRSNVPVNGRMDDYSFGLGYRREYGDQSAWLLSLDYGSASDVAYGRAEDSTFTSNFAYIFAPKELSHWVFFVNYSNNRTFLNNIPLPAFAYIYRPSKQLSLILGIPFAFMRWMDFPSHSVNFFLAPSAVGADLGLGVWGPLQVFMNASYRARSFMHSKRINDEYRLILEEKKATLGLRSPLSRGLIFEIGGGVAFDRVYYEGEGAFDPVGKKREISDDAFVEASMKFRF